MIRFRPSRLAPVFLLPLLGCPASEPTARPRERTELVVVTRNAPTTYYEDRSGRLAGLEYELASDFARYLDLPVRFELFDSVEEILRAVDENDCDLAAAGLTKTASRAERYLTGPEYQSIEELAVCNRSVKVRRPRHLVGRRLAVISGSSYEETLEELDDRLPGLVWATTSEKSTEELLQEVWRGELDCTVADSNIVAIDRRYMPDLQTPFALSEPEPLVWLLPETSADLQAPLAEWFEQLQESGRLRALIDRYYSYVQEFDYFDTAVFYRRIETRLPTWRPLFVAAEEATGFPWPLLAAVSYQESHWDPEAVSPTGVRGLMMLTLDTAAKLGIADRTDPEASILGGGRHLQSLVDRVPAFIRKPDRLWFALAAYNVGFGHLQDARILAIRTGKNPNTWSGVKETLPLLSQSRYFRSLRHGYARGHEPVVFVERIRNYYDLLQEAFEGGPPSPDQQADAVAAAEPAIR